MYLLLDVGVTFGYTINHIYLLQYIVGVIFIVTIDALSDHDWVVSSGIINYNIRCNYCKINIDR